MSEEGNGRLGDTWLDAGAGSRTVLAARRESAPKRFLASIGFVLDATSKRRTGRRALTALVVILAGAGLFMLSYPWITDLWAHRIQGRLQQQFDHLQVSPGTNYRTTPIAIGSAVTRLRIPMLHVKVVVVEGWTGNALRAGAGHKPGTSLPGDPIGNVAIAGHRTGFGEPFRHLELLKPGDRIELDTPIGTFAYEVVPPFDNHGNPWTTNPSDFSVVGPTPYGALTLVTCDPPHTSKNRLIVRARLVQF